jgi:hypothetical protein
MSKIFVLFAILIFCFASGQIVSAQTGIDEKEFENILKSEFKQVAVVAYVDVKERALIDSIGNGDCESDKGGGSCLYRLKAELKEIYKGKIRTKEIIFYTSLDADYPKKNLLGEKVVFLNWRKRDSEKKKELYTLENSTRSMEHNILKRIRKIAGKKY